MAKAQNRLYASSEQEGTVSPRQLRDKESVCFKSWLETRLILTIPNLSLTAAIPCHPTDPSNHNSKASNAVIIYAIYAVFDSSLFQNACASSSSLTHSSFLRVSFRRIVSDHGQPFGM